MQLSAFTYRNEESVVRHLRPLRADDDTISIGFVNDSTHRVLTITTDDTGVLVLTYSTIGDPQAVPECAVLGRFHPDGTLTIYEHIAARKRHPSAQPQSEFVLIHPSQEEPDQ